MQDSNEEFNSNNQNINKFKEENKYLTNLKNSLEEEFSTKASKVTEILNSVSQIEDQICKI